MVRATNSSRSASRRGSALLFAIWTVVVLSFAVMGVVKITAAGMSETVSESRRLRARLQAETGFAIACHPMIGMQSPLLSKEDGPGEGYKAKIEDENGRININLLLNDQKQDVLLRLFSLWELPLSDSIKLLESLRDWVDGDDLVRLQGAESTDYIKKGRPGFPRNSQIKNLDELELVLGAEPLNASKPGWKKNFSLWSSDRLNIGSASETAMVAYLNISQAQASAIVALRRGPDGAENTEDDVPLTNVGALGLPPAALALVTVSPPGAPSVRHIVCEGYSGEVRVVIEAVVRTSQGSLNLMEWSER